MTPALLATWCLERAALNRNALELYYLHRPGGYEPEVKALTDEAEKLEAIAGYLKQLPEAQPQPESAV